MKRVTGFLGFLYRHHFVRYLFVGGTTFLLDVGILIFCREVFNMPLEIATTISYWTSVTYNFCFNRWWTFSASEERALHEHAVQYGLLLAGNYLFTLVFVTTVGSHIHYGIAKVLATGIQVIWTYPLYKYVIFKLSGTESTQ